MIKEYKEARSDKVERKGCAQKEIWAWWEGYNTLQHEKKCILNLISNTKMCNYYNLICRRDNIMGDLCWYLFCVKFIWGISLNISCYIFIQEQKKVVKIGSFLCSSVARSLKGRRKGMQKIQADFSLSVFYCVSDIPL